MCKTVQLSVEFRIRKPIRIRFLHIFARIAKINFFAIFANKNARHGAHNDKFLTYMFIV